MHAAFRDILLKKTLSIKTRSSFIAMGMKHQVTKAVCVNSVEEKHYECSYAT